MGHRIFVQFKDGSWISTDCPDFALELQSLVRQLGEPTLVEYRAADKT